MAKIAVFSPHLDDAVLSTFAHLSSWRIKHSCTVISVFTSFSSSSVPPYSLDILKRLSLTTREYEKKRKQEDREVLTENDFSWLHLDYIDGAFRSSQKKPLYRTPQELFSGTIHNHDLRLMKSLKDTVKSVSTSFDLVLSPLAVGNHVDHLIVRKAVESAVPRKKIAYYLEVPYWYKPQQLLPHCTKLLLAKKSIRTGDYTKVQALQKYDSQYPLLFPKGIRITPEVILCENDLP